MGKRVRIISGIIIVGFVCFLGVIAGLTMIPPYDSLLFSLVKIAIALFILLFFIFILRAGRQENTKEIRVPKRRKRYPWFEPPR